MMFGWLRRVLDKESTPDPDAARRYLDAIHRQWNQDKQLGDIEAALLRYERRVR